MINVQVPMTQSPSLRPTITVVGVGGAGGNAVNNMIAASLEGASFVVANTDAQALDLSRADRVIQLGPSLTKGQGAGAKPEVGKAAAEEAFDDIAANINGSNMVFIAAGMGGGTGTGAAPVIARAAKEQGILTVAVVTKPFQFEGMQRMRAAEEGIKELQDYVDTLIVIPNQNLFRVANERTTFADAFRMADEVLHSGVRGITDLIVKPGLVNLDFADVRTVMLEMGKAVMGTGEAEGENRAVQAAEAAISNPLLDDLSLKGAKALLLNITGGMDMTLFEVDEAANRVRQEVDPEANIIFGSSFSDAMQGRIRVSVIATGIDAAVAQTPQKVATLVAEQKRPFSFAAPKPELRMTARASEAPKIAPMQAKPFEPPRVAPVVRQEPAVAMRVEEEMDVLVMEDPVAPMLAPVVESVTDTAAQARAIAEVLPVRSAPQQEEEKEAGFAWGLFSKSAEKRRPVVAAPAPRVEAAERSVPQVQITEKPRAEVSEKLATDEDQYLDIPAFLRRQAN